MNSKLTEYIAKNKLCSELLFRDWDEFLDLLYSNGGFVKEILWFEYILIDQQAESMGGGGYQEKINPKYMWAETTIYDKQLEHKSLIELKEYINQTIRSYIPHTLVPCFFDISV